MKLIPQPIRELRAQNGTNAVSAASGLVKNNNYFYVIADDQLSLARFELQSPTKFELIPLLAGNLPVDFKKRKKTKPDWESLCKISNPELSGLLAVPSGSTENREMGIFVNMKGDTISNDFPLKINFSEIFSELRLKLPDLNIEGSVVFNDQLKLFQRGNGAGGMNAMIDIDLNGFIEDVQHGRAIEARHILQINPIHLGESNGVKLGITDACACGDTIWFLAAAEDSSSTYNDGRFCGAILGGLNSAGEIKYNFDLDCLAKPEGLWIERENNSLSVYIVTDADNSDACSSIYQLQLNI